MTKDVGILVLGLLIAAMPFLGFPGSIEQIVYVLGGLLIALLAFFIRGDIDGGKHRTESYVQNGNAVKGTAEEGVTKDHAEGEHNG